MINPQELRIGNYVEYMGEIKPIICIDSEYDAANKSYKGSVIIPINATDVSVRCVQCIDLTPIPITPYCLDTLGFKEETHLYPIKNVHKEIIRLYKMGAIWIYFTNDNLHSVCTSSGSTEHSHIKYVHQLQNLYHAHKNKDLTFKTTTHEQK